MIKTSTTLVHMILYGKGFLTGSGLRHGYSCFRSFLTDHSNIVALFLNKAFCSSIMIHSALCILVGTETRSY